MRKFEVPRKAGGCRGICEIGKMVREVEAYDTNGPVVECANPIRAASIQGSERDMGETSSTTSVEP